MKQSQKNIKLVLEFSPDRVYGGGDLEQQITQLKQDNKEVMDALRELVDLKEMKDNYGKTGAYMHRKPVAWFNAREIIQGDNTESG